MSLDFWAISSVYCHCRHLVKKKEKGDFVESLFFAVVSGETIEKNHSKVSLTISCGVWVEPVKDYDNFFFTFTFELTVHVIHPITFGQELIYFVRLLNRWSMGDKKATGFLES